MLTGEALARDALADLLAGHPRGVVGLATNQGVEEEEEDAADADETEHGGGEICGCHALAFAPTEVSSGAASRRRVVDHVAVHDRHRHVDFLDCVGLLPR